MKYGVYFSKTYSPLASCAPLTMFLTLTLDHCEYTIRLDAKHAFAHAPAKTMVNIIELAGGKLDDGCNPCDYVPKIFFQDLRTDTGRSVVLEQTLGKEMCEQTCY